jgi:hypothetical protein
MPVLQDGNQERTNQYAVGGQAMLSMLQGSSRSGSPLEQHQWVIHDGSLHAHDTKSNTLKSVWNWKERSPTPNGWKIEGGKRRGEAQGFEHRNASVRTSRGGGDASRGVGQERRHLGDG